VGLVLFEMLTGSGPFDDGSISPKPPSSYLHGQISPQLDAIVLRAIMDDPAARYQTAHEFIDALQAYRASCSGGGSARATHDQGKRAHDAKQCRRIPRCDAQQRGLRHV